MPIKVIVPEAGSSSEGADALITNTTLDGENQAQVAYRVLEEMIVTMKLPPGSKISEKGLNRTLGLGRTPIREALQRLANEGTVCILPRAGVLVSEIDIVDQLNMIEVRRELEGLIAGRAARLATVDQRQTYRELVRSFNEAADKDDAEIFISADREFNMLGLKAAQNKYLTYAITPIGAQTRRFWYMHFQRFGDDVPHSAHLHADICERIAAADEPGARQASDRLLDYVVEYTRRSLHFLIGI